VEQHPGLAVKLVRDRRFRAVATCTVCSAVLSQGPEASYPGLAAFALGISMGSVLGEAAAQLFQRFHLGPGCPGGSIRLTIEELRPARGTS
jgi:hypothetical protein